MADLRQDQHCLRLWGRRVRPSCVGGPCPSTSPDLCRYRGAPGKMGPEPRCPSRGLGLVMQRQWERPQLSCSGQLLPRGAGQAWAACLQARAVSASGLSFSPATAGRPPGLPFPAELAPRPGHFGLTGPLLLDVVIGGDFPGTWSAGWGWPEAFGCEINVSLLCTPGC